MLNIIMYIFEIREFKFFIGFYIYRNYSCQYFFQFLLCEIDNMFIILNDIYILNIKLYIFDKKNYLSKVICL